MTPPTTTTILLAPGAMPAPIFTDVLITAPAGPAVELVSMALASTAPAVPPRGGSDDPSIPPVQPGERIHSIWERDGMRGLHGPHAPLPLPACQRFSRQMDQLFRPRSDTRAWRLPPTPIREDRS